MYQIENSIGTYEIIEIAGKPVYIFESHNMAFPAWGTVSSRNKKTYTLITFDYHTDTRTPFSKVKVTGEYDPLWIGSLKLKPNDFVFQDAFGLASLMIAYDEQIKTACKYGYINEYFVICAEDERGCFFGADSDKAEGYNAKYFNKLQIDRFFDMIQPDLYEKQLIVDFDVDFFNSEDELNDAFFMRISPLLKQADAITIAKEKWHFEDRRETPTFLHSKAIELLLNGLQTALK